MRGESVRGALKMPNVTGLWVRTNSICVTFADGPMVTTNKHTSARGLLKEVERLRRKADVLERLADPAVREVIGL